MELRKQRRAERGGTEIILFSPVFPSRLKKSSKEAGQKSSHSVFLPVPPLI